MDMPDLYSLVKTDGQGHKALLEEQANSTKAGYASAKQNHWSLSFQSKISDFLGQVERIRQIICLERSLLMISGIPPGPSSDLEPQWKMKAGTLRHQLLQKCRCNFEIVLKLTGCSYLC
jgi:hypothetical protein